MPTTQDFQDSQNDLQISGNTIDAHTSAANHHEMAANYHHEAARFHATGDHDQAGQCAKKAQDHGQLAMQCATKCCQYHTNNNN